MVAIQDFQIDLGLLVEAGLIAIKQGDEESAKRVFAAVGVIDPENSAPKMGYGLIALHKMDIATAQKQFQEILQIEKDNWRAMAFLAFSHILSVLQEGSHDQKYTALQKGAELAQTVLDNCEAPSTRQLAQSILDWEQELVQKGENRPKG